MPYFVECLVTFQCSVHVCYSSSLCLSLPSPSSPLLSPSFLPPSFLQLSILMKTPIKMFGLYQTRVIQVTIFFTIGPEGHIPPPHNIILELPYLSLYLYLLDGMKWEIFLYHIYIIYHSCIRQEGNIHQWNLWSRIFLYKCRFLKNIIKMQEVYHLYKNTNNACYLNL